MFQSLELIADAEDDFDGPYTGNNSRAQTPGANPTMVVLPTPIKLSEVTAAQQKKMRDKEYQRRKRASAARERSLLATTADEDAATSSARRTIKRPRSGDDD